MPSDSLKASVLRAALDAGFAAARILAPWPGAAGRGIPANYGETAASILVTALSWGNGEHGAGRVAGAEPETGPDQVEIAPFARRNWYGEAVERLKRLAGDFRRNFGGDGTASLKRSYRIFCNSPVPEKPLAQAAGLGVLGRNSLVITAEAGSQVILAAMTLPFELESDVPLAAGDFPWCGNCTPPACVAVCPTGAVRGDGTLILERCIQWYASGGDIQRLAASPRTAGTATLDATTADVVTAGAMPSDQTATPDATIAVPALAAAAPSGRTAAFDATTAVPDPAAPAPSDRTAAFDATTADVAMAGPAPAVPVEVAAQWGRRLYGCTSCQDACPHNRKPLAGATSALGPLPSRLDGRELLSLDNTALKARFRGTAMGMAWIGPETLRRSLRIALGIHA